MGINTAKSLVKKKYKLVLLCKKKKGKKIPYKNLRYKYCDIRKLNNLKKTLDEKYDCVINFSGNINHRNKKEVYETHFQGLKNILKVIENKNIKLFIQAGSCLEYGKKNSPQKESNNCQPISFYGKAKYYASKHIFKKKHNFKFVILRMYQIYGPNQKMDRLIPITINSCLKGKKFDCTDGKQKRDFLFIDDLTYLIEKIIKKKNIISGIYNIGAGQPITVKKVINQIRLIIKKGKPVFGGIKMRNDEIKVLYPNTSKVRKIFKWRPRINLSKGLKKTINYYGKQF